MSKAIVTANQSKQLAAHRREVARAAISNAPGTDKLWHLVNGLYVRHDTVNGEKLYSIVDAVALFSKNDTDDTRRYWSDQKRVLIGTNTEVYEKIVQLKMLAPDGKMRTTDAAPLWVLLAIINEMKTPTSHDLINAIFKGVAGGIENAALRYRAANIEGGSEWAANDIHERMRLLDKPTDDGLKWWQK